MRSLASAFLVLANLCLCSTALAQSTYDTLLNFSLMEESRCGGRGGSWSGMTCSGGNGGSGSLTREDLEALQNAINTWHRSEMRKATCLMIVAVDKEPRQFAQKMSAHVSQYQPQEIHIFREYGRYHRNGTGPLLLTHGFTRILIGSSLDQRIRRGEVPRNARCTNIEYVEKNFKLVASAQRQVMPTQDVRYELSGDVAVINQIVGQ